MTAARPSSDFARKKRTPILPGRSVTKHDVQAAWRDIVAGWSYRQLWSTMAMQDIRKRYRRSKIGPFWLTISMGVMVSALGVLYGMLFKLDITEFLPYVASGFVIWGLLSTLILDGTKAFIDSEGLISQLPVPLSTHVYRDVWRNFIIFAHNIWIYVAISLWFGVFPSIGGVLSLLGLAIIAVNAIWFGLFLGLVSARFRDVPQIVASVVQVSFFLTPIIWKADMLPERAAVLMWNPFYHYLHIVRGPLLGDFPTASTWLAVAIMTVAGWTVTLFIYSKYRWRIAYWV